MEDLNRRIYDAGYRKNNREKLRLFQQEWYLKNRERILLHKREYYQKTKDHKLRKNMNYYNSNKAKIIERQRIFNQGRIKTPKEKVSGSFSSNIWRTIKDIKAGRKWETLVGYSLGDLMTHLEKQFDRNMNWDNYGPYWHIDHIKPIALFSYICPEDEEFKQCWSLNNLQPLEAIANIRKGKNYD